MKKFKFFPLLLTLLLVISLLPGSALAVTAPDVSAFAAVLIDANNGEVYFEKNADQPMSPAGISLVMTALLTIEAIERGEISLSDPVVASENVSMDLTDASKDASPRILIGEQLKVEDLLYLIMLISADDAANMLAEYVAGSIDAFVEDMNARATELGCTNTHFSRCSGAEAEDNFTTAMDMARIAREAVNHRLYQTVSGAQSYTVASTNAAGARELVSDNALLNTGSEYRYEPSYSGKNAYSDYAGYCLISAARQNDINAVCALMGGQSSGDQFRETASLYRWLYNNFESTQIVSATTTILTTPVELGAEDSVDIRAENGVTVVLPYDFDMSRISYEYVLYHEQSGKPLEAPVTAGQLLGELTVVELNENKQRIQTYGTSRLVAASSVDVSRVEYLRSQFAALLQQPMVLKIVKILLIVLAVYLLLAIIYFFQRMHHLRTLRKAKKARARHQTEEDAQWLSIPESKNEEPAIGYFNEPADAPRLQEPSQQKAEKPKAVKTEKPKSVKTEKPKAVKTARTPKAANEKKPVPVETSVPAELELEVPVEEEPKPAPVEAPQEFGRVINFQSPVSGKQEEDIFNDEFFDNFFKT